VEENLLLGAFRQAAAREMHRNLASCFETFPRLAERRTQLAGSMSGGEQQMLALGRALMLAPKILLVDEPSVGLGSPAGQPHHRRHQAAQGPVPAHRADGGQNFTQAIRIADRGYVIVHGKIAVEGRSADELNNNDLIKKFYLGL
jgi:branched-chain amino acid transport system ATP-binding protein